MPEGIAAVYSCSAGQKSYDDPDRKVALFFEHAARAWKGEYSGAMPVTLEAFFEQVATRPTPGTAPRRSTPAGTEP